MGRNEVTDSKLICSVQLPGSEHTCVNDYLYYFIPRAAADGDHSDHQDTRVV